MSEEAGCEDRAPPVQQMGQSSERATRRTWFAQCGTEPDGAGVSKALLRAVDALGGVDPV